MIWARVLTFYYFVHFLVIILPLLGLPRDAETDTVVDLRRGAEEGMAARPCCSALRHLARCLVSLAVAWLAARSRRRMARRSRRATSGRSRAGSASSTGRSCSAASRSTRRSAQTCHGLKPAFVPQPRRSGRSGIHAGAGGRHRGRIQGAGRAERSGRDVRARRPAGRPFPAAEHLEERAAGAPALQRHGAARHVGARQGAQLRARLSAGSSSMRCRSSSIQEHGVDYIHGAAEGLQGQAAGRLHAAGRAATTTNTSPAIRSRCRRR